MRPPARLSIAAAALVGACDGLAVDASAPREPVPALLAPLSVDTTVVVVALGRAADFQPWGGVADVVGGTPPEARARLAGVPEGRHHARLAGWAAISFVAPDPPGTPPQAYCLRDAADADVLVVSGGDRATRLATSSRAVDCARLGSDRWAVTPAYTPDPTHVFYGAEGGANVATLYLDGWPAHAALEVEVASGDAPAPVGVFAALPDTAGGATWPDHTTWNLTRLAVTADDHGDARAYLVARPNAQPSLWDVHVAPEGSVDGAGLRLWIAAVAGVPGCAPSDCDDGEACTVDVCDPIAGCQNAGRPDGEACGDGRLCVAAACARGVVLRASTAPNGSLTGDCSNDGTATTSFAQIRVGNSAILGDPPLEIVRYGALTFDLSVLPSEVVVAEASLHVYQERVDGDGPYGAGVLERVVAEHVSFTSLYGGCDTWSPIAGTIGQALVSDRRALGWYAADVGAAVVYGVGAAPRRVQLRLRFVPATGDGDGDDDLVVYASDNTVTPERVPWLLVRFGP